MIEVPIPEIKIGRTRLLDDMAPLELKDIRSVQVLFESFLTDVFLLPNKYQFIVDSFPFLHEILAKIYCLNELHDFSLNIGEGLNILGQAIDKNKAEFEVNVVNCDAVEYRFKLTTSGLLLFLIRMACDLEASISAVGIDVPESLKKFPPALF